MNKRPYFFEIIAAANVVLIAVLLWPISRPVTELPAALVSSLAGFLLQVAAGVGLRALLAWRRNRLRRYLIVIRSRRWLSDTLRFGIGSALFVHAYAWIKLGIPLLHHRLFDQELWNLDARMFAGYSPNIFFLTLFSAPPVLRVIDWTYANIFFASLVIAIAFFGSSPSRRQRLGFMNSNVAMWLIGAWLYVALPSLGPAYRFPQLWQPLAPLLDRTQTFQRMLMSNYVNVLQSARGIPRPINPLFGVAAFPSLHVAFQMLVFLWMRRLSRVGELIVGVFFVAILIGSVVTGWHYLIDGLAGIALAWICYAVAIRSARRTF